MRVLLIEDDSAMAHAIELTLRSEGFEVCSTDLGDDGILLSRLFYDIIVLDLQLPDMSGFDLLEALRAAKIKAPVLVLSGNAIVESKVKALGIGADDYMTKPFHKEELIARIKAIVRRSTVHAQPCAGSDEVIVNFKAKTVELEGVRRKLTDKEAQTLFQAVAPFLAPAQLTSHQTADTSLLD